MNQYQHGWYFVAFIEELAQPITPLEIGNKRLMIIRNEEGVNVYCADCPHRGAHLAYGGELAGNAVICPFHHYQVGLSGSSTNGFQTRRYQTIVVDGLVLVRLSAEHDYGVAAFLEELTDEHRFVPAFTRHIAAPPELIIENGFDNAHFRPVHKVSADKFIATTAPAGNLQVESNFHVTFNIPVGGRSVEHKADSSLHLNAFSPGFSIARVGGRMPYVLITGATPNADGSTTLRLALGMSRKIYGDPPKEKWLNHFIVSSEAGISDDQAIWEHLALDAPQQFTAQDKAIEAFQKFCQPFYEESHATVQS